jgi:hypothetical protein
MQDLIIPIVTLVLGCGLWETIRKFVVFKQKKPISDTVVITEEYRLILEVHRQEIANLRSRIVELEAEVLELQGKAVQNEGYVKGPGGLEI